MHFRCRICDEREKNVKNWAKKKWNEIGVDGTTRKHWLHIIDFCFIEFYWCSFWCWIAEQRSRLILRAPLIYSNGFYIFVYIYILCIHINIVRDEINRKRCCDDEFFLFIAVVFVHFSVCLSLSQCLASICFIFIRFFSYLLLLLYLPCDRIERDCIA